MTCQPEMNVYIGSSASPFVLTSVPGEVGAEWSQLTLPDWSLRLIYAPPVEGVPGNILLSAAEDSGEVVMTVNIQGSTADDLQTRRNALKAALAAWPGEFKVVLVEEAGSTTVAGPWQSFPTVPRWGEVRALLSGIYLQDAAFSLPVNPIGAPV